MADTVELSDFPQCEPVDHFPIASKLGAEPKTLRDELQTVLLQGLSDGTHRARLKSECSDGDSGLSCRYQFIFNHEQSPWVRTYLLELGHAVDPADSAGNRATDTTIREIKSLQCDTEGHVQTPINAHVENLHWLNWASPKQLSELSQCESFVPSSMTFSESLEPKTLGEDLTQVLLDGLADGSYELKMKSVCTPVENLLDCRFHLSFDNVTAPWSRHYFLEIDRPAGVAASTGTVERRGGRVALKSLQCFVTP